jgi:Cytochrome bd terminal oxidase subunit I
MEFDPVLLSRIPFAFVISFHIIFPAFTIGLAAWLATLEGARLWLALRQRRCSRTTSWSAASTPTSGTGTRLDMCWPARTAHGWHASSRSSASHSEESTRAVSTVA